MSSVPPLAALTDLQTAGTAGLLVLALGFALWEPVLRLGLIAVRQEGDPSRLGSRVARIGLALLFLGCAGAVAGPALLGTGSAADRTAYWLDDRDACFDITRETFDEPGVSALRRSAPELARRARSVERITCDVNIEGVSSAARVWRFENAATARRAAERARTRGALCLAGATVVTAHDAFDLGSLCRRLGAELLPRVSGPAERPDGDTEKLVIMLDRPVVAPGHLGVLPVPQDARELT